MSKTKFSKYFIFISILTFFVIFLLIIHESYSKQVKQLDEVKQDAILKDFNPSLDIETIRDIIKKEDILN